MRYFIVLIMFFAQMFAGEPNLMQNGSFDENPYFKGWEEVSGRFYTQQRSDGYDKVHYGKNYGVMFPHYYDYPKITQEMDIEQGYRYRFSFIATAVMELSNQKVVVEYVGTDIKKEIEIKNLTTSSSNWKRYTSYLPRAPKDAKKVKVTISVDPSYSGKAGFYFDDFSLTKIPFEYKEGNFIRIAHNENRHPEWGHGFAVYGFDVYKKKVYELESDPHSWLNNARGAGYNPEDKKIWVYHSGGKTGHLTSFDLDFNRIESYKIPVTTSLYGGAFVADGYFYIRSTYSGLHKIDLSATPPEVVGRVAINVRFNNHCDAGSEYNTVNADSDIGYSSLDKKIYFISDGKLARMKLTKNSRIEYLSLSRKPFNSNTATYTWDLIFDKAGILYMHPYAGNGRSNKLYKVNIGDGSKTSYETEDMGIVDGRTDSYLPQGASTPIGGVATDDNDTPPPEPAESICYAIDDTGSNLYKVDMSPGANPLPLATKIKLKGLTKSLNGEGEAFNSQDGLVYAFHQDDKTNKPVILYSINPKNGQVSKVAQYNHMKTDVTGASFYDGYLYVIAKHPGSNTLYKIDTSDWSIVSEKGLSGVVSKGDGLAINKNGEAYIIRDRQHKIYKFDLESGRTSYLLKIDRTNTDAEALSFASDGNLYTENSEDRVRNDTDRLFKIDLSTGRLTAAAQIPRRDDVDIEGLACNVGDDSVVAGKFNIDNVTEREGSDGGLTNFKFTVSLSEASAQEVKIDYATEDDSAVSGEDYIAKSGTLVFAAGGGFQEHHSAG